MASGFLKLIIQVCTVCESGPYKGGGGVGVYRAVGGRKWVLYVNDSPSPGRGNELVKTRYLQCLEFVKTTFIGIHCLKKTLLIRERLLMKLQNKIRSY